MVFYHNGTRYAAVVTIRITSVQNPEKTLTTGTPSVKAMLSLDIGVHDVQVGPGESIQLEEGVDAQFLSARGA